MDQILTPSMFEGGRRGRRDYWEVEDDQCADGHGERLVQTDAPSPAFGSDLSNTGTVMEDAMEDWWSDVGCDGEVDGVDGRMTTLAMFLHSFEVTI